jgi:RsiW-degrading membrane proteinase PrsW (M82 family)
VITRIVILVAAIIPALLVLACAVAKGRGSWRSEAMWSAFLFGAVSALAAIVCEVLLVYLAPKGLMDSTAASAVSALLIAAAPEEAIKFLVLVNFCEKHVDARRLQDVIVLAVAVSLGFASAENVFYVASVTAWQTTASLRAMTAVPAHGINGLAMGALLTAARLSCDRKPWRMTVALAVPIALHAGYDFWLFALAKVDEKTWFVAGWLGTLALSSIVAIALSIKCFRQPWRRTAGLGVTPALSRRPIGFLRAGLLHSRSVPCSRRRCPS